MLLLTANGNFESLRVSGAKSVGHNTLIASCIRIANIVQPQIADNCGLIGAFRLAYACFRCAVTAATTVMHCEDVSTFAFTYILIVMTPFNFQLIGGR